MLLFRNSFVVMLVVVVISVWVKSVWGAKEFHAKLKHFHIYGCTNKTITKPFLKVKQIRNASGLYIGLSSTAKDTVPLLSELSLPCKLPTDTLFHASVTSGGDPFTVTFQVMANNTKAQAGSDNTTENQEDESVWQAVRDSGVSGERKDVSRTCNASVGDKLTLEFGYAFIACPDDPAVIKKMWMEWQESVRVTEEKNAQLKRNVILGVSCGPAALVVFIVTCALCRLRSSPDRNIRRRPSTISGGRTGSTHDHHSVRT